MLNSKYTERMQKILGEEQFDKYIACFSEKPCRSFHINTHKISADEFLSIFPYEISPVPYLENSYYFDIDGIGNHPFHHAGMFYIQEPAAMFPVGSIEIKNNWKVLDMCAAPGGKSSQAMQQLSQNGQLVSNEINPTRCKILCGNFERLGFKNATVTCASSEKLSDIYENYFDLVIVDAPCSGEGMFRKDPIAVSDWSEEHVKSCADRQKIILDNAAKCVVGGGYVLYSTCTFSVEENEEIIQDFLNKHENFKPVPLSERCINFTAPGINLSRNSHYHNDCMRRFYPFISKGEGQFAALLQNTDDNYTPQKIKIPYRRPNKDEQKIISQFIDENLSDVDYDNIFINKDTVILCDNTKLYPDKSYMCGVTVGKLQKNYIKPHHQLFSALGDRFVRKIDFIPDDENLKHYLHGESFNICADKGWSAVTVNGVALGGCKVVDGYLKNHYPKGLHIIK